MKLELRRNDVLLRLPQYTEDITRETTSGLSVATLKSQTYNPVSGEVIQVSPFCSNVKVGDTAFFQIFTFSNAKERCYGDENPDFDEYKPVTHYAWLENGVWYMIIRESDLYFLQRDKLEICKDEFWVKNNDTNKPIYNIVSTEIICLSNYTLARPIQKEKVESSGLLCVDIKKEQYRPNEAIIFRSSHKDLKEGMIVQTLRHCDITIEEQLNCPILPEDFFIIETKNIISCIKQ